MPSPDPHIDANGAAGLLQEVFLAAVTSAQRICQSCGPSPARAHPAYADAGTVLRCPECGDLAAARHDGVQRVRAAQDLGVQRGRARS